MNKKNRKHIADKIRYELQEGEHTFTICTACNKRGCRTERCWECWLDIMVEDGITNWIMKDSETVQIAKEEEKNV